MTAPARYMEEHVAVRCKDSTAEGMRKLVDKHILPAFGKLPLLAVERERVVVFHARLSGVPYRNRPGRTHRPPHRRGGVDGHA